MHAVRECAKVLIVAYINLHLGQMPSLAALSFNLGKPKLNHTQIPELGKHGTRICKPD